MSETEAYLLGGREMTHIQVNSQHKGERFPEVQDQGSAGLQEGAALSGWHSMC